MELQKPSIGRIVHFYRVGDGQPHPAVITQVFTDTCVNLAVFASGEMLWPTSVVYGTAAEGTAENRLRWCWPPRV